MRQIVFANYNDIGTDDVSVTVTYSDGMIFTFTEEADMKAVQAQIERQQRESKDNE